MNNRFDLILFGLNSSQNDRNRGLQVSGFLPGNTGKYFKMVTRKRSCRSVSIFKHMILVISDFQDKNLTF